MKKLLSDRNGIKTTMEVNGDKTTISKSQDISAALKFNKAHASELGKKIYSDTYNYAAQIPASVQIKWLWEEGLDIFNPDHAERLRRKLNSNEWKYLRTSELVI